MRERQVIARALKPTEGFLAASVPSASMHVWISSLVRSAHPGPMEALSVQCLLELSVLHVHSCSLAHGATERRN